MDFSISERQKHWRERVVAFMDAHVYPAVETYERQDAEGERWKVIPIVEELKAKAKAEGLWNLFLPPSTHDEGEYHGAGLTNLDYALCAEQMGRVAWASEVFNCSAPDTGNMEVLHRYGSAEQKRKWLKPLLAGEIRSAYLMTEPAVASSDATNIETSIVRDGDDYVINGRKWWSSGVGDPRCKIAIVMGKTDPSRARHEQQSQILVPLDTKGVNVLRMLPVFGYDDAPHGHAEVVLDKVRVPATNLVLGEGRGFEIAQGRLGPGRIHHCMRTIGAAEVALEKMTKRLLSRVAFGKKIAEHSIWEQRIARRAHRHRDDAAPVSKGRRHDGQGRQQGGATGNRHDQGGRAAHRVTRDRRCHPGAWRHGRHDRCGAGEILRAHSHHAAGRRAGRSS